MPVQATHPVLVKTSFELSILSSSVSCLEVFQGPGGSGFIQLISLCGPLVGQPVLTRPKSPRHDSSAKSDDKTDLGIF